MKVIRGKKGLITGAASGIGREIALALAREGVHLYLVDVEETQLAKVVDEATALGVEAVGVRCDLSKPVEISRTVRALLGQWEHIDILVNNAGVAYYGPTDKMTAEQWDWLLGINLLAPVQLTRELLPTLIARPEAHILNVCSISGLVAGGRFAAYHVSKFGLVGFSEALRAEYSRRGLGVSALCPGPVRTNLYRAAASGKPGKAVPEPPAWLCASAEKVAQQAVVSIRKNRRLTLVSPMAHLLFNVKRFAPWFLDFLNHVQRKKRTKVAETESRPAGTGKDEQRKAA
ncbi:MAG: SDR family NAD(P)-dependent oxidoreductase [Planctomycetaceae bacterium]